METLPWPTELQSLSHTQLPWRQSKSWLTGGRGVLGGLQQRDMARSSKYVLSGPCLPAQQTQQLQLLQETRHVE